MSIYRFLPYYFWSLSLFLFIAFFNILASNPLVNFLSPFLSRDLFLLLFFLFYFLIFYRSLLILYLLITRRHVDRELIKNKTSIYLFFYFTNRLLSSDHCPFIYRSLTFYSIDHCSDRRLVI